jgi:hypothetical protein
MLQNVRNILRWPQLYKPQFCSDPSVGKCYRAAPSPSFLFMWCTDNYRSVHLIRPTEGRQTNKHRGESLWLLAEIISRSGIFLVINVFVVSVKSANAVE